MRYTLIITILLLNLAICSYGQADKTENSNKKVVGDSTKELLKGNVKFLRETISDAYYKLSEKKTGYTDNYYKNGKKIKCCIYNPNGKLKFKETYKYNEKGSLIQEDKYWPSNIHYKATYRYDEKENLLEKYYNGKLDNKYTYKYDEKGNMLEKCEYDGNGTLEEKLTLKYDERGYNIEINYFDSKSRLDYKETYKYDEKGNMIEVNGYDFEDNFDFKSICKYDEKQNLIEVNSFNTDGSLESTTKFEYTYDVQGNWITKTEFDYDKPKYFAKRKIKYKY